MSEVRMDHAEELLYNLLVGLKRVALPHSLHIFIFFPFILFLNFTLVRKERRARWIILRDEGGFLLHWLYISICI